MTRLTYYPYHACQTVTWSKEMALGDKQDLENTFEWARFVRNLLGTTTYDCCRPWVYKERSDGSIADDLFVYVDYGNEIVPI